MLLQLITQHPEAIPTILRNTPVWVGGLFAALVALGLSQVRDRQVSLTRVSITPVAMTVFSAWGVASAFGSNAQLGTVLALWLGITIAVAALVASGSSNARYDATARSFALPGSYLPMALILGIFLTKYAVGVELAMNPRQAADPTFALGVAALYGVFSGVFTGRTARLWKQALRSPAQRPALA